MAPKPHSFHLQDAPELREVADRIRKRDATLIKAARGFWLQNGLDLIAAKDLVGHGHFEEWCRRELEYSKSKAEKLMAAAKLFMPLLKNTPVTDFPPPTQAYKLAAKTTPEQVRAAFLPRVIAREPAVGRELSRAIRNSRKPPQSMDAPSTSSVGGEGTPTQVDKSQVTQSHAENDKLKRVARVFERAKSQLALYFYARQKNVSMSNLDILVALDQDHIPPAVRSSLVQMERAVENTLLNQRRHSK